jgi:hypothetical protein
MASGYDMKGSLSYLLLESKKMVFSVKVNAMYLYSHQMEGGSYVPSSF